MFKITCLVGLITVVLLREANQTCKENVFRYLETYNPAYLPSAILCTLTEFTHENTYLYGILALNTEYTLQHGFNHIKYVFENGMFYSSIYFIPFLSETPFPALTEKVYQLDGITMLKMFYEDEHLKSSVQFQLYLILKILDGKENTSMLTDKKKYMVLDVEAPQKSLNEWLNEENNVERENRLNSRIIKYHKINARAGNQGSNFFLGHVYHQGQLGIEANTERAMEHYNNAPDVQGVHNNMAQLLLGSAEEGDVETAMELLEEGAESEDTYSLLNLGLIYIQGKHGKKKDEEKAIKLLTRAAKLGHEEANFILGVYLKENPKLDKKKESSKFLEKAADKGHSGAKISLAQSDLLLGSYNQGLKRVVDSLEHIKDTWVFKNRIHNSLKRGNYHAALFNSTVLAELKIESGMVNAVSLAIIMQNQIKKRKYKASKNMDFDTVVLDRIIVRYLTRLGHKHTRYLTILGNYHYQRKEFTSAVKCYEHAAKSKDKWGSAILASMFLVGNKVERDWDRANHYANNLAYTEKDFANILLKIVVNSAVKIKGFFSYGIMDGHEL